jgi:hypothetical protein
MDEGSSATDLGNVPAAIVPVEVSAPVVASMVYMEMVLLSSLHHRHAPLPGV